MRPALMRLLARPSSLDLLRVLVGRPATVSKRGASGLALRKEEGWEEEEEDVRDGHGVQARAYDPVRRFLSMVPSKSTFTSLKASKNSRQRIPRCSTSSASRRPVQAGTPRSLLRKQASGGAEWSKKTWSTKELDLESNLLDPDPTRLLNREEHSLDQDLWLILLEYRQRTYGSEGVRMFWDAIVERRIRLVTRGHSSAQMWSWILKTALEEEDEVMLEEIFRYSEEVYEVHGERWNRLSLNILEHFLTKGTQEKAMLWYTRLAKNHPLGNRLFRDLFYKVALDGGNMAALKEIYQQSIHHNVYVKIVPTLCTQEKFKTALEWHQLLLEHKDLPPTRATVEPLLGYLSRYQPQDTALFIDNLHKAEVSFASGLPLEFSKFTPKNSKKFVSDVHTKTFHVSEKQYNDSLGARWLATSWIALDTAIKAIHALGVTEIGPLSLHSIAIREPDAHRVISRIDQLKNLGISIGSSYFCLAVEHFAKTQQQEYLDGLLQSDQHPHELDDMALQERLLGQFARERDWPQFRRTLEVISFRCKVPEIEKRNLMMRISLREGDVTNIKANLTNMQHDCIPVKNGTIFTILEAVLGHRQMGHKPTTFGGRKPPLDDSIDLLRQIIHGGSHVPIQFWREIVRRLGMLGHFHALEDLCLKIATWYAPGAYRSRTPAHVSTRNPNHPFRILFEDTLQEAIVEWGFIHTLDGRNLVHYPDLTITSGIRLLRKLSERGVYINRNSVRSAVINRLCIYYGPGESNKSYNRAARKRIEMSLREMVECIDNETEVTNFAGMDIERIVAGDGRKRLRNRGLKGRRDRVGLGRSGSVK